MTDERAASDVPAEQQLAAQRLRLDIEDLRFENARLKTSIAERQAEIVALSKRLGDLQARLEKFHRVTAWGLTLRRLGLLRFLLRRQ